MTVDAMEMERAALPPPGTIVTGAFEKETADAKTGVAIRKQRGNIMITGIIPDSLAANGTDLQPGLQVKSINDTNVDGLSIEEAAKLLVEAVGVVTIAAVVPDPQDNTDNITKSSDPLTSLKSYCCPASSSE